MTLHANLDVSSVRPVIGDTVGSRFSSSKSEDQGFSNLGVGSSSSWVRPIDERELMNVSESGAWAGVLRVDGFPCD